MGLGTSAAVPAGLEARFCELHRQGFEYARGQSSCMNGLTTVAYPAALSASTAPPGRGGSTARSAHIFEVLDFSIHLSFGSATIAVIHPQGRNL